MSYADKLKDPRWQRRRLEVLKAADFACESCGDKDNTLHVHHPYYAKGKQPWEYDNLVCLCERCHSNVEREMHYIAEVFAGMSPSERCNVSAGFITAQGADGNKAKAVSDGIRESIIGDKCAELFPTMGLGERFDLAAILFQEAM